MDGMPHNCDGEFKVRPGYLYHCLRLPRGDVDVNKDASLQLLQVANSTNFTNPTTPRPHDFVFTNCERRLWLQHLAYSISIPTTILLYFTVNGALRAT